eukprot:m.133053 g.133053  ORF g.133053 m.133053 type:complete len:53 (-) comp9490_c0_seq3:887-1045(-)
MVTLNKQFLSPPLSAHFVPTAAQISLLLYFNIFTILPKNQLSPLQHRVVMAK